MPAKKTTKKRASKKSDAPKSLGLFDHLNAVKVDQDPDYFKKISDTDKKTWSNWMIIRALSYNDSYLEFVNELQMYCGSLEPEKMYRLLIDVIPQQKTYDKFINGKRDKFSEMLVKTVAKFYEISELDAIDYIEIYNLTSQGKEELMDLCEKFGHSRKEIKKWK